MSVNVLIICYGVCPTYSSSIADFLLELQEKLGNEFECFDSLGKSSFF